MRDFASLHRVKRRFIEQDFARLRELLDAIGEIDWIAVDVIVLNRDFAGADADAEVDALVIADGGVVFTHRLLNLPRGEHGIGGAVERDEKRIADGLDDGAAAGLDDRLDELAGAAN